MDSILASRWFQILMVPLILMLVGVLAKRLGRRDGDDSPRQNDWAVGTTILLMLLGIMVGDLRGAHTQVEGLLGWLVGLLITTFFSLDHDRFRSWERDAADNKPTNTKRLWVGVILPDVLCLAMFAIYQGHKVNLI